MIFIIGSVFLILVVGFTYIIEKRKMKRFKNEMIIFKNIKEKIFYRHEE